MPTSDVIELTKIKSILVTSLAKTKQHLDQGAYKKGYDNLAEALTNAYHTTTWGELTPCDYRDGSVEGTLWREIEDLYQEANKLQGTCQLAENIEQTIKELAELATRIEKSPNTPNQQALLQQVKHLKSSWELFAERKLSHNQVYQMFELTEEAVDEAKEELAKLIISPYYTLVYDCETAQDEERVLAGIYARIASFFNEVIALFQQYVSEPVQNAARSTASFFNARSVPTVSDEPDAEEAYSPPALQS